MNHEPGTHTLLRIADADSLLETTAPSPWVIESLRCAPWVVVRRAAASGSRIAVGVRGAQRVQRHASWIETCAILEKVTPQDLARSRSWRSCARRGAIPAIAALDSVEAIMSGQGFSQAWGPTGSVGFELATGWTSASPASDLDLALWMDEPMTAPVARYLVSALENLGVRSDLLIEMPRGAAALSEIARAGPVMLRTVSGPRLVQS